MTDAEFRAHQVEAWRAESWLQLWRLLGVLCSTPTLRVGDVRSPGNVALLVGAYGPSALFDLVVGR